jgi:molecular chaperone DnaK
MGRREKIRLRDRDFSPEQLAAFLLQKIKQDAEAFLGEPVEKAVVTVPAYFDDNQRSATKDVCGIADIEVARLVNEPTAASLAYGIDRLEQDLRIAVIDLGSGTLDVTIMEFGKGVFEVKATSGDTQLGGTDMNQSLFAHLANRFQAATGVDIRGDHKAEMRLIEAAEIAKIELSH